MRLAERTAGRDNNFNLIRFAAASAVMISHAWPITGGAGTPEPLEAGTGASLGRWAVYVFFAISGFLISASFERASGIGDFLRARMLRIYPGLGISVILVALVLGPVASELSLGAYLSAPETWRFIATNATALRNQYELPGVFASNPYPAVEGSIWTLVHELTCYVLVLVAGLVGWHRRPGVAVAGFAAYALFWAAPLIWAVDWPQRLLDLRALSLPFLCGMAAWRSRRFIVLSPWWLAALAAAAWAGAGGPQAPVLAAILVTYATLCAAYLPGGAIRQFNRLGDYSYGLYIYAFPLQGLAVWAFGAAGPMHNLLLALPATLVVAVLSWHWIERPALGLRRRGAQPTAATAAQPARRD